MAAKKNDKPGTSSVPEINSDKVPLSKRLAMGQKPDTGAGSGKKTPA
jgi:hypothetical protein